MNTPRTEITAKIQSTIATSPVTGLLGPRQCGKTTLARDIAAQQKATYFDLEDPEDQARLENPKLTLAPLQGLVVLDEIQRRPDLLPLLRVLADRQPLASGTPISGRPTAAPSWICWCTPMASGGALNLSIKMLPK